jgi:hypothetical protein
LNSMRIAKGTANNATRSSVYVSQSGIFFTR